VRHRAFWQVATVAGLAFVVHVSESGADELDARDPLVESRAAEARASLSLGE
jgi:hypothetical protein